MSLTVAQAIAAYNANPNLAPVAVADIAANIGGSALDQLQALTSHGKLQSITVTDTSTAYGRVSATTAQIGAQFGDGDSATLALIVSPYRLLVSDLYSQFYGNIPSNCNDIYLQQARGWSIYGNNFFDTILITAAYVPGFFNGAHDLTAGNAGSYIVLNNVADSHEQATLLGGAGGGPAGPGNTIYANDGDNFLQGGAGSPSDVLVATGSGRNQLFGGSGNNYIVGGTGRNIIVGGGGALQSLYGYSNGSGDNGDYIVGGTGAGASDVLVENGIGNAQLWGALNGNNYIVGGIGSDLLVGGGGTNYLFGGAGNDTIYGGAGTDYIYPGFGNDFIWTNPVGVQSTGYIYEGVGTGVDTVADFTPGDGANHDVLVLTAASSELTSFADVQAKAVQAGVYTVLPLSATDQIYLYNVQPFQLTANDFIFT